MVEDNKKKWIVILGIGTYLLFSFAYYMIKYGMQGFSYMLNKLTTNLMWLSVIALVVGVLYFLFIYEKKVDANFEVYNKILKETTLICPDNLKNIYVEGDCEHKSVRIGKVVGLSIRSNYSTSGDNSETIFKVRVTPKGWIRWFMSLFAKPVIIRCPSNLHDSLQGDVYMKCTSLVMHGFYYYPNVIHLKADMIDETMYYEAERFIQLDLISKASPLIYRGIGLTIQDMEAFKPKTGMDIYTDMKQKTDGIGMAR